MKHPSAKNTFVTMRDTLAALVTHLPETFPQIHWDPTLELTVTGGIKSDPVDLDIAAWSRGSVLPYWDDMVERIVKIAERYGFSTPGDTQQGGAGNRIINIYAAKESPEERVITLESLKATNLSISAQRLINDDKSLVDSVVWRNGKNVLEPRHASNPS